MVHLHVRDAGGALLFSAALPDTATVGDVMEQINTHAPQLRDRISGISNRARGTSVACRSPVPRGGVDAQRLSQTLADAGLVQRGAAEETIHLLLTAPAPAPAPAALSPADAAARMMQLFAGGGGAAAAAAAAAASVRARAATATNAIAGGARPSPIAAASGAAAPAPAAPSDGTEPDGMTAYQIEMQRRIYAQIQQQQIDENLANALEYTPEAFARVIMLYVPCTINQIPIKAFVDSGAQNSIMNMRTAERCGLMRLLDVRMRGVAVGVGRQEIIGRIHMTPVNLSGMHIPFAFYVIEDQPMDLIIGLDQLKRHQMLINLRDNCLVIDDVTVPFLPESELPRSAEVDIDGNGESSDGGAAAQAADPHANEEATPRHHDPMPTAPAVTAAAATSGATPPAAPASSLPPPPPQQQQQQQPFPAPDEAERQLRVRSFMDFTGINEVGEAARLLEAADWDADAAAALFFEE